MDPETQQKFRSLAHDCDSNYRITNYEADNQANSCCQVKINKSTKHTH